MWKVLDYIFVLRPVLMPPVWTVVLLGYNQERRAIGGEGPIGLVLLLSTALVGAIYLVNQLCDVESDRLNRKLFLIADGYLSERSAHVETWSLFLLSVLGAFLLRRELGGVFLLSVVWGLAYSLPPLAWKNRPVAGLLANMSGHGILAFTFGWLSAASPSSLMVAHAVPYSFAIGAIYLNTTLPDIRGDRLSGKLTLGVKLGVSKTCRLSTSFVLAAIVGSLVMRDWPLFVSSLVVFPLFVWMTVSGALSTVVRATKASVLVLSAAVGLIFPWYLPLLVVGYVGSRVYYKKRFGLDYPNLGAT